MLSSISHARLVDRLYAGITDADALGQFLAELASSCACPAAELGIGFPSNDDSITFSAGIDEATWRDYEEYYHEVDVVAQLAAQVELPLLDVCQPHHIDFDMEELRGTEIFNGWYRQIGDHGVHHSTLMLFRPIGPDMVYFGLYRDERHGAFDDDAIEAQRRLIPHVDRALHVMERLRRAEREMNRYGSALDQMELGLILCDGASRVRWANGAGRAAVDRQCGLRVVGNRLVAMDERVRRPLGTALAKAAAGDDGVFGCTLDGGGEPWQVAVMSGGRVPAAGLPNDLAVVFICDGRPSEVSTLILQALHGLSPAEARVVAHLCRGLAPATIASRLAVGQETVRSQLKSASAKMGARGQREVVARALGGPHRSHPIG